MRVHQFESGFETVQPGGGVERELLPDGTHNVVIKEASEGPHKFPENYPGDFLSLTLSPNGPYGLAWCSLGISDRDRALASQLAAALGYTAHEWAEADPADLVGRRVRATTRQVTTKSGRTRVYVNAFLPPEVPSEPVKSPTPNTAAAKVAKAKGEKVGGADDVPF